MEFSKTRPAAPLRAMSRLFGVWALLIMAGTIGQKSWACQTKSAQLAPPSAADKIGDTRIARWKNDKTAAFCLMFDDSIPSDVATVVPELKKRDMVGTFYINPGGFGWQKDRRAWEQELPASPSVVYANHTMTHKGARSVEQLADELKQCNDVIYKLIPGKQPRLISFGRPGVNKEDWTVSDDAVKTLLAQNHMVERPPFGDHGAMIAMTTPEQMVKRADSAIAQKGMDFIVFHGVGGDWIVTPTATFVQFLDRLAARRSQLWITDAMSAHKYETERDAAHVLVQSADTKQIRLAVQAKIDPLYDAPLTVITRVPNGWHDCDVTQGKTSAKYTAEAGLLRYDVTPGDLPIVIRPAKSTN